MVVLIGHRVAQEDRPGQSSWTSCSQSLALCRDVYATETSRDNLVMSLGDGKIGVLVVTTGARRLSWKPVDA